MVTFFILQLLRTDVWQCGPPFARNAGKLVAAACSQACNT